MKVFLIGFMASGKTHCGKLLALRLGYNFIDLDEKIEAERGKSITEIFSSDGEASFRVLEKKMLRSIEQDNMVISTGGGTACYHDNINFMKDNGLTVFLNPSYEIILERLMSEKGKRPIIDAIPEHEFKNYTRNLFQQRLPFYQNADLTIESENDMEIIDLIIEVIDSLK